MIHDSKKISKHFGREMPLRLDSDIILATSADAHHQNFNLFALSHPGRGSLIMINKIGFCDGRFNFYKNQSFYQNRFNMTGVFLKTAIVVIQYANFEIHVLSYFF